MIMINMFIVGMKKKHRLNKITEEIQSRWEYFWRCSDYLSIYGKEDIKLFGSRLSKKSDISDMILNKKNVIKTKKIYKKLKKFLSNMKKIIIHAHIEHNNYLISKHTVKIKCPNKFCEDNECYSDIKSKKTTKCGCYVLWDISEVDFLNDVTLDNISPVGKIVLDWERSISK